MVKVWHFSHSLPSALLIFVGSALCAVPASGAQRLGGGGLGFSCDTDFGVCKCEGGLESKDCKAMVKNCTIALACATELDGRQWCWCKTSAAPGIRGGSVLSPELPTAPALIAPE
jgi:hypothetical protein